MTRRRRAALLLALLLAGCGSFGAEEGEGEATLWITRDRGATVLFEGRVPAGLTVMQALRREADVVTGYGGRFVHAIEGIEGSLADGRDWFYFVNGIAADRGAAEYRLRAGEVAWWDYRRWRGEPEVRVVVGAFPEPFLHGYDGHVPPAVVRYRGRQRAGARAIGKLIRAVSVAPAGVPVPRGANVFRIVSGPAGFVASAARPGGPVTFTFSGDAERLARQPERVRFRYEGVG